jgi:hypothetical protein
LPTTLWALRFSFALQLLLSSAFSFLLCSRRLNDSLACRWNLHNNCARDNSRDGELHRNLFARRGVLKSHTYALFSSVVCSRLNGKINLQAAAAGDGNRI